uniref:Uncharacterized protein n=1 Tax=Bionectria ochroleuca TaxID=29856 RepID=A0A8H7KAC4_BIOOC
MPFDFKKYDQKCAALTAEELQREWQHYTRLITGAATSTTVSGLAIPLTAGVSTIGVALAAPAIHNARKKRDIIERHLNRHNTTHQTRKRDVLGGVAVSGTIGVVTLGVGTLGADAIAAQGAEHGISAIVENETAIKVVSHVALDGVGLGIEHAHTNHLKKRDARKAFEAAGVFQAVNEAKAAEAGYTIQPYNPQGVAAESSASLPYYAPPPPYSYASGSSQVGIPENYAVSTMNPDPYYGLDSKAPMPPYYQSEPSQELYAGTQTEDFAPPSMPPPTVSGTYDMNAMGAALPTVGTAVPVSHALGHQSNQGFDVSRSASFGDQGAYLQAPVQPLDFSELPVGAPTQPPVSATPAVVLSSSASSGIVTSPPVSVSTSVISSLPPIVSAAEVNDSRTQPPNEFMYPPPAAPPPGHANSAQPKPLPDTRGPLYAGETSSTSLSTTTPVFCQVLPNAQTEPQTPYQPARGTLTGYSLHTIEQPSFPPLSAQGAEASSSADYHTEFSVLPNHAPTARKSGIPLIPQTPQPSSHLALGAVQSSPNEVQEPSGFHHPASAQPGSLQRHLTTPVAPKPLNASRRASVVPLPSYPQQNFSSPPTESQQPQYILQSSPMYGQETFHRPQSSMPYNNFALPPTPQSLPTSPPGFPANSTGPSYFPQGAAVASNNTSETVAQTSHSSLPPSKPDQENFNNLPAQSLPLHFPVNLPATPMASPTPAAV